MNGPEAAATQVAADRRGHPARWHLFDEARRLGFGFWQQNGHGLPLNVGGSLAIGWGATAVVRLIFGVPSAADVQLLLGELGIRASGVRPAARQVWGVAKYEASETGRTDRADRLGIAVYGRDAADARLFTKAGRFVLYRDSGRA